MLRIALLLIVSSCSSALLLTAPARGLPLLSTQRRGHPRCCTQSDEDDLRDSDEASADSGLKILMPPVESLGLMPEEATSFAGYLAPYAVLVLLAFVLASAAFALLVLGG
tara:strand:+ start:1921 stop:2250 length:330 start_codon:yes stop_codon:yes gene_type:complete